MEQPRKKQIGLSLAAFLAMGDVAEAALVQPDVLGNTSFTENNQELDTNPIVTQERFRIGSPEHFVGTIVPTPSKIFRENIYPSEIRDDNIFPNSGLSIFYESSLQELASSYRYGIFTGNDFSGPGCLYWATIEGGKTETDHPILTGDIEYFLSAKVFPKHVAVQEIASEDIDINLLTIETEPDDGEVGIASALRELALYVANSFPEATPGMTHINEEIIPVKVPGIETLIPTQVTQQMGCFSSLEIHKKTDGGFIVRVVPGKVVIDSTTLVK